MGGWNSGSVRRSEIATTADAIALPMAALKDLSVVQSARHALEADQTAITELEILAKEGGYRLRAWLGTRTRYGLPGSAGEVPRAEWLSEDSLFIAVVATRPNYGGVRLWFICPRSECHRRCAVLYRETQTNARAFTCLRCSRLVYATQRMSRIDRAEYRAAKMTLRLDASPNQPNAYRKPKWMRWRTFDRIVGEIDAIDRQWRPVRVTQFAPFRRLLSEIDKEMASPHPALYKKT